MLHGFPYERRYQAGKMLFDAVFPILIDLIIGGIIVEMADGKADFLDYSFRILYSVLSANCKRSSSVNWCEFARGLGIWFPGAAHWKDKIFSLF